MAEQLSSYDCPNCGGPLRYDPKEGKLKCDYCDSLFTQVEVDEFYGSEEREAADASFEQVSDSFDQDEFIHYHCPECGAEILAGENTAVTKCPYCDNPLVIAKQFEAKKPKYILPFEITKKRAVEILDEYYAHKPLLPNLFKDHNHIEEVKGVYVPFWLYDAVFGADVTYDASRSNTYRRGDDQITETEHFRVVRRGQVVFEGVPADASKTMRDDYMDSLEPFDYAKMKDFSTMYMAGYMADSYDVEASENQERVDSRMRNTTAERMCETVVGYTSVLTLHQHIRCLSGRATYVFLPVWLLVTKWHDQNYLFAINGQTGKIVGELPSDPKKLWGYVFRTFVIAFLLVLAISMMF